MHSHEIAGDDRWTGRRTYLKSPFKTKVMLKATCSLCQLRGMIALVRMLIDSMLMLMLLLPDCLLSCDWC